MTETNLAQAVEAAGDASTYDTNVKYLKVRSIWICFSHEEDGDSIEEINLERKTVFGKKKSTHGIDLMQGIIVNIRDGENMKDSSNELISMLEELFSRRDVEEKKRILAEEYGMIMTTQLEGRVQNMCNWSEHFIEKGIEQGVEKGTRQAIIDLLEDLGVIPEDIRRRIFTETNMEILRKWHKFAARSESFEGFRESIL